MKKSDKKVIKTCQKSEYQNVKRVTQITYMCLKVSKKWYT